MWCIVTNCSVFLYVGDRIFSQCIDRKNTQPLETLALKPIVIIIIITCVIMHMVHTAERNKNRVLK